MRRGSSEVSKVANLDRIEQLHAKFVDYKMAASHDVRADGGTPLPNGMEYATLREFFGRSDELLPGPQGFLVEVVPPHTSVGAHFHSTDQFQVFFPSEGAWYQRHPIDDVLVHYTDAYTTYGPFGSGAIPMCFYTLRPVASTVTGYMPGSRDRLPYRGQRNTTVDVRSHLRQPRSAGESHIETLIEPHDDGLAAYLLTAGPSAVASPPSPPARSAGQYLALLTGRIRHNDEWLVERSLGWSWPTSQPAQLEADPDSGFELLILQLPVPTTEVRPNAATPGEISRNITDSSRSEVLEGDQKPAITAARYAL
jgi:hypothetical protein